MSHLMLSMDGSRIFSTCKTCAITRTDFPIKVISSPEASFSFRAQYIIGLSKEFLCVFPSFINDTEHILCGEDKHLSLKVRTCEKLLCPLLCSSATVNIGAEIQLGRMRGISNLSHDWLFLLFFSLTFKYYFLP